MVGHVLRFHPAFERLKELIDAGELGEVKYIHSHRLGLGKFHTENDALWDLAPHDLSMILAITGCEPVEVRGEGAALLDHLSAISRISTCGFRTACAAICSPRGSIPTASGA